MSRVMVLILTIQTPYYYLFRATLFMRNFFKVPNLSASCTVSVANRSRRARVKLAQNKELEARFTKMKYSVNYCQGSSWPNLDKFENYKNYI